MRLLRWAGIVLLLIGIALGARATPAFGPNDEQMLRPLRESSGGEGYREANGDLYDISRQVIIENGKTRIYKVTHIYDRSGEARKMISEGPNRTSVRLKDKDGLFNIETVIRDDIPYWGTPVPRKTAYLLSGSCVLAGCLLAVMSFLLARRTKRESDVARSGAARE